MGLKFNFLSYSELLAMASLTLKSSTLKSKLKVTKDRFLLFD